MRSTGEYFWLTAIETIKTWISNGIVTNVICILYMYLRTHQIFFSLLKYRAITFKSSLLSAKWRPFYNTRFCIDKKAKIYQITGRITQWAPCRRSDQRQMACSWLDHIQLIKRSEEEPFHLPRPPPPPSLWYCPITAEYQKNNAKLVTHSPLMSQQIYI